jgi:hypothetical protein
MAVVSEQLAHAQATRLPIAQIVAYLQDILGQRLTAVIAGVGDAKAVGKWARGERLPHPDTEMHLRHAFQVAELLMQVEAADTVRAWFRGMHPDLGDEAPASVIATEPARVLHAARAFLAHG